MVAVLDFPTSTAGFDDHETRHRGVHDIRNVFFFRTCDLQMGSKSGALEIILL